MPIIGSLVLSDETLKCCEKNIRVKKPDFNKFVYYPNLYMINGSGGYGFVLAPYLARMLKEHIVASKPISDRLSPARFFARWAKKT
jgi:tRNA 5-methylaminomethyl-2-thiouridine biosynthesis bifunctional protein